MSSTPDETLVIKGKPLTLYCPFTKNACVINCEWHGGEGCVIWQLLKALKELKK